MINYYLIEPTFDPACEKERMPELKCRDCGGLFFELIETSSGDEVCQGCYDQMPWFSNCCGYEANGLDLDYQICGDCRDHCEYVK